MAAFLSQTALTDRLARWCAVVGCGPPASTYIVGEVCLTGLTLTSWVPPLLRKFPKPFSNSNNLASYLWVYDQLREVYDESSCCSATYALHTLRETYSGDSFASAASHETRLAGAPALRSSPTPHNRIVLCRSTQWRTEDTNLSRRPTLHLPTHFNVTRRAAYYRRRSCKSSTTTGAKPNNSLSSKPSFDFGTGKATSTLTTHCLDLGRRLQPRLHVQVPCRSPTGLAASA